MAKWKQTNTHNVLDHGDVIKSWWSLVCCLRAVDCPLLQTWDYTAHFSSNVSVNNEMNLIMIAGWFSRPQNFRTNGNVRFLEANWMGHSQFGSTQSTPRPTKERLEIQALELLMVRWRWWYAHGSSLLKLWNPKTPESLLTYLSSHSHRS